LPLLVNRQLPAPSKRFLDLTELGTHPLSLCLAPELEAGPVLPRAAVMCQPEEIERFRLALTVPGSPFGSVSAELDEPCLLGVQAERKRRQAFFEIVQEVLRITPVLEPDD
jgi:hypothetical protein